MEVAGSAFNHPQSNTGPRVDDLPVINTSLYIPTSDVVPVVTTPWYYDPLTYYGVSLMVFGLLAMVVAYAVTRPERLE